MAANSPISIAENVHPRVPVAPVAASQELPRSSPSTGALVFQNTFVQLAGRFVSLLLSAATSILLARYLGRERMGEYGALYAYLALYSWLATFSLEQILAREVSRRRSEAEMILHTGSMIGLSFAVAGTFLASLLAPLFGYAGQLRWLVALAALDLLILPPIRLPGIVFQVDMKQWLSVVVGLARQTLWLAALALLVMRSGAFPYVILARTACGFLEAGLVLKVCGRPGLLEGARRFDWGEARRLMRFAFPLAMSAVTVGIFQRIDQVMIHYMQGGGALGPYVIAVQLTEQFGALPVALISSLFPVLALSVAEDDRFQHYLGISYRFLMVVVFFACAVVTPVTVPLVTLLYGKDFVGAGSLINVLIWSEAPLFLGVALTNALIAKNLQRFLPVATLVGAVMNIGLNLWAIPRWGALGASWATVISYAVATVLFYLFFRASRGMTWQGLRIALPLLLLSLGITGLLHSLPMPIVPKILVAASLYCAGAWLTRSVRPEEVRRFISVIRGATRFARAETV